MKMCKQANESTCGKMCCCAECDTKDTCPDVCNEINDYENCEDAFDEEVSLQEFQKAVPVAIEAISSILQEKAQIEAKEKEMREQLLEAMKKYGVKSFKNDLINITYKAPSSRTSIDSTKLKKEHPDIAAQYTKTSSVKESVVIKLND